MRRLLPTLALVALWIGVGGCADEVTSPLPPTEQADAHLGAETFALECAGCHASRDGFDLAFFSFPDSTIIRRALGHVNMDDALDIVAHIRTLPVAGVDRGERIFQPAGWLLEDDRAFAMGLFREDDWPEDLTAETLRAIDPLLVPVAVPLPRWSDEGENLDWMPDRPLDDGILGFMGAGEAELAYQEDPTDLNLVRAVSKLRSSGRRTDNPDAPCLLNDEERVNYAVCFEVQRWVASLGAQHMLRNGQTTGIHRTVHDAFWDVGQTVRRSIVRGKLDFQNGVENWAAWMYLGWMFEPGNHASTYTGTGLVRVGLPRHATFVALRSMVERSPASHHPYKDLRSGARFAPAHWVYEVTQFGLEHLLERLESGDIPRDTANETVEDLRNVVIRAMSDAIRKDPAVRELQDLAFAVLDYLD